MKSFNNNWKLGYVLIVVSIFLIMIGVYREEIFTVLYKASAICMECIGIG